MEQHEIRPAMEKIKDRIQDLQGEIEVERARWGVLTKKCRHPNAYETSSMGDIGTHCPDCGKST